jgi:hypothetical protein
MANSELGMDLSWMSSQKLKDPTFTSEDQGMVGDLVGGGLMGLLE